MHLRRRGNGKGLGLMATKVEDLVNRIRELSGDTEIQRFEILGLRDDLETANARVAELEAELAVSTEKGSEASPTT